MSGTLKELLLSGSDDMLDPIAKATVIEWSEKPTAIQILKTLDLCINGSLCGGLIVAVLQQEYKVTCSEQNTTHEEVVKQAVWRDM